MTINYSPRISTDGLVLCLDAGNTKSYPGSGTTWFDISGNGYNFTLTNSPVFETHRNARCFTFSGVNDYATRAGSISHDIGQSCTLFIVMASVGNGNFGSCSRLFSVNDGGTNNVDFSNYFTLASCDESRFGLWKLGSPQGMYPSSSLKTVTDEYKLLCYKWTSSSNAYVYVNNALENSSSTSSAFSYTTVGRMTIAMNSALNIENSYVRVASVYMYDRELNENELSQTYRAIRGRYGI
jgi:hypothetical protein